MPVIVFNPPNPAEPVRTLSVFTAAGVTGGGSSLLLPAGIQRGDLILVWDQKFISGGTPPASVTPSGFTEIVSSTDSIAGRANWSYRIATTGIEGGTSIAGMSGANGSFFYIVLRGDVDINTVTVLDTAGEITNGNPSGQTVNASGGVSPLAVVASWARSTLASGNAVNPRTFSPAETAEITDGSTIRFVKYKIYNITDTPQSHSVDMDDEGSGNTLQSFYLEIA